MRANRLFNVSSRHLVQRRRKDIQRLWQEQDVLPEKESVEMTYHLAGPWGDFFEEVRQYCLHEAQSTNNRMIWYAMLAMLRCISSMQKGTCKRWPESLPYLELACGVWGRFAD